jgi:N utilization substance protein B
MSKGLRRQGRELALKAIYGLHEGDVTAAQFMQEFWNNFRFQDDILGEPLEDAGEAVAPDVKMFAEGLVLGTIENLARIDEVIGEFSTNWSLERMARVDLALLRLGAHELLYCPDVPPNVVINEAIELGKQYGTRETQAFINGILDKIARTYRQGGK